MPSPLPDVISYFTPNTLGNINIKSNKQKMLPMLQQTDKQTKQINKTTKEWLLVGCKQHSHTLVDRILTQCSTLAWPGRIVWH